MNNLIDFENYDFIADEEIFNNISEFNNCESFEVNNFIILHVNIRSINNNLSSLELYIEQFKKNLTL